MEESRLDRALRSFQEQASRASQLKEKIAGLRGQGRNPDGSVTVTVAPSGAVLGLNLSPLAMRKTHTQLQKEILGAIRQATEQAAAQLQATVEPVLGERAEQFKEAFNAHVPAVGPAAPEPAAAPGPPQPVRTPRNRPASPEVEPDDFGGPILRREQ
ncbi:YbaB/EbfC family nucleoid-associated protein [Amycolatopsis pithecellobii]|uniref:YbaB/EbfC family DNA-binding protein n=1 Tax=Amycolatopsis pithecellobii TaxID=664692 RepID=A0A6N7YXI6_9PSEU|nr:YbaB/EbfC family nucleoid-associated protein [Amycolatopsis pithecellobii]MTD57785.1 YbaB/EbfC family DNA-binding protein [Amycolatopsis pithecellobii]